MPDQNLRKIVNEKYKGLFVELAGKWDLKRQYIARCFYNPKTAGEIEIKKKIIAEMGNFKAISKIELIEIENRKLNEKLLKSI